MRARAWNFIGFGRSRRVGAGWLSGRPTSAEPLADAVAYGGRARALAPRIIAPQTTDPAIDWVPAVNPQFNYHYVWLDRPRNPTASCSCSCQAPTASRGAINCWSKRRRAWATT